MVWAITAALFLGMAVVALLIFFIYSRTEQIRKVQKEKRKEERTPLEVELELSTPREPPIYENPLPRTPAAMVRALSAGRAGKRTTTHSLDCHGETSL
jgi:hypothetical protein